MPSAWIWQKEETLIHARRSIRRDREEGGVLPEDSEPLKMSRNNEEGKFRRNEGWRKGQLDLCWQWPLVVAAVAANSGCWWWWREGRERERESLLKKS